MSGAETSVWITGIGQCSSIATGYPAFCEALRAGVSGMAPLDLERPFGRGLGAALPDPPRNNTIKARLTALLHRVLTEALADAGLSHSQGRPLELPVVVASNFGSHLEWLSAGDFLDPVGDVMAELGLAGEPWGISTACASGGNGIGLAMDLVRHEGYPYVLACGYDLIGDYNYRGLASLSALSADEIRPFDGQRSGTLLGEGAGALVIESAAGARARGAKPHGALLGYGTANDGYHSTAPEPGGRGMCRAMREALRQSGLTPEAIDHLNVHGTGTRQNDKIETRAIHTVFGAHAHAVSITASKPAIGHTMGASGMLEAIVTLATLRMQRVPPILGLQVPAPECDLDFVYGKCQPRSMRVAMSNSYGLWGCYSSIVLGLTGDCEGFRAVP